MAIGTARRQFGQFLGGKTVSGPTEVQLLDRFVSGGDDTAFTALVARHGPMVRAVCRRLLSDPNDVDDAFQATFLVLVRKAPTLRRRELLGNWLYGVAARVAMRARASTSRRRSVEAAAAVVAEPAAPRDTSAPADPALHEELGRLPEKYRAPLVLCYLEGLTHTQAADQLGWPLGTVKGRLARARELLRSRLARRGVGLALAAAALEALRHDARAAVPARLAQSTLQAATSAAAGWSLFSLGPGSPQVVALTEGVTPAMSAVSFKSIAVTLTVALACAGGGAFAFQFTGSAPTTPRGKDQTTDQPRGKAARPEIGTPAPAPSRYSGATPARPGGAASAPKMGKPGRMGPLTSSEAGVDWYQGWPVEPLDRLDALLMELSPLIAQPVLSGKTRAILAQIEEPIDLHFPDETPLEDVLRFIVRATSRPNSKPLPIYMDPVGFQEAEQTLQSPVSINLDGAPLKVGLRLILDQLGLAYDVRDGMLLISALEDVALTRAYNYDNIEIPRMEPILRPLFIWERDSRRSSGPKRSRR